MKRRLRLLVPFALALAAMVSAREAIACSLVPLGAYDELAPNVWVSRSLPEAQRSAVLPMVRTARGRVASLLGNAPENSRLIITPAVGWLAGNSTGATHYAMWGAFTVIGPDGQNVDVVAHELTHARLFEWLGWSTMLFSMPAWFDEGVAMQVDERERYGTKAWDELRLRGTVPPRSELRWNRQFFDDDAVAHYVQAKHEVATLIEDEGVDGLRQRIADLAARGTDALQLRP